MKVYENGKLISTKGSWQAGVGGAYGGVVMPGEPRVGQAYRQEYYASEAEDRGEVLTSTNRPPCRSGLSTGS